ncbi:MAG: VanZ family protein [Puniceicoccaceae bacterium]|nr:MAG: VanZ family protein [Puniceicoccaceae bacterium]
MPEHLARQLWIWPLLLAATLTFASHQVFPEVPGEFSHRDKLAHFLVFGLLGTLVYRSLWHGRPGPAPILAALVLTSLFGAFDEWHQSFIPGRSAEVADWIADTLGAAVAILAYRFWPAYRTLLERPLRRNPAMASS